MNFSFLLRRGISLSVLSLVSAALLSSCGGTSSDPVVVAAELKGNDLVLYKGQNYPALKQVLTGLQAYTTTISVTQGESAKFHISDTSGSILKTRNAAASVYRIGLKEELVSSATVATKKQTVPANA